MRPGRRVRKHGEIQRHARTDDVKDPYREQADASALVEEGEVKTAARHRNAARLRVDVRAVQLGKYPIGGDDVDVTIGAFVPRRPVRVGGVVVRFVVEEFERLFALLESPGVRVLGAFPHAEADLDVQPVRVARQNERRPQPTVDRRRRDIADGVDS